MHILFIPFTSFENNTHLIDMADRWIKAYANDPRHKSYERRVVGFGQQCLDDVPKDVPVYVLAHGNGTMSVQNKLAFETGGTFFLNADEIARRISLAGLGSNHQVIKLSICNTNGTLKNFAKKLKEEMWQLNYSGALTVYYYEGSVTGGVVNANGIAHRYSTLSPTVYVPQPNGSFAFATAKSFRKSA